MDQATWDRIASMAGVPPDSATVYIGLRHAPGVRGVSRSGFRIDAANDRVINGHQLGYVPGGPWDTLVILRYIAGPWFNHVVYADPAVLREYDGDEDAIARAAWASVEAEVIGLLDPAPAAADATPAPPADDWFETALASAESAAHNEREAMFTTDAPGIRSLPGDEPPPDVPVWRPLHAAHADDGLPHAATLFDAARVTIGLPADPDGDTPPDGSGILVAVLDTGCAADHPAFENNPVGTVSTIPQEPSGIDRNGHGTWCVGAICGRHDTPDGVRFVGVAPRVRVLSVQVLTSAGWGTDRMIAAGLRVARTAGAKVVSMSIGGRERMPETEAEIRHCLDAGLIVVAAAGNSGPGRDTVDYPGRLPGVVTVGASSTAATGGGRVAVADFSSTGPDVDVIAPGTRLAGPNPAGGYSVLSGTSMSCPIVAGIAARWCGLALADGSGDRKPYQLLADRLSDTSSRARVVLYDPTRHGDGLLDAGLLLAPTPPAPEPDPTPDPEGLVITLSGNELKLFVAGIETLQKVANTVAAGGTVAVTATRPVPEPKPL